MWAWYSNQTPLYFPTIPSSLSSSTWKKANRILTHINSMGDLYRDFYPLDSGDLSLVALLRTTSILMEVTAFQYVIVFVTALLMMTAPFFLVLINRRIIAPARQICSVMQDFGQGNLSIRFQQPHVYEEFQLIGSTFNHMATEIGQLKIAAYEKQLDAQRTEMQFLQLQLTPHFYINSLNVIYSLAQTADFPTIQKWSWP